MVAKSGSDLRRASVSLDGLRSTGGVWEVSPVARAVTTRSVLACEGANAPFGTSRRHHMVRRSAGGGGGVRARGGRRWRSRSVKASARYGVCCSSMENAAGGLSCRLVRARRSRRLWPSDEAGKCPEEAVQSIHQLHACSCGAIRWYGAIRGYGAFRGLRRGGDRRACRPLCGASAPAPACTAPCEPSRAPVGS